MPPQTPRSAPNGHIGELIREARDQALMTQDALAREIGVQARTVSLWEQGHHKPRRGHLRAIAQATGKPLAYFTVQALLVLGVL